MYKYTLYNTYTNCCAANAIQGPSIIYLFFFVPAFKIDLIRGFECNYNLAYKFQYKQY